MSKVISCNEGNFEEVVLKSDVPVLVDFYAPWCGPCRQIAPILETLATNLGDRAKVVKVNVDEEQALSGAYQIRSLPTLLFVKDGQVYENRGPGTTLSEMERLLTE